MNRTVTLPSGTVVPALGQGTWRMAEEADRRSDEIASLRLGIELGMTLIDTAEMYADGGAEELVAEAIRGERDRVYLVSKVYPHRAGRRTVVTACEESLARLKTDRLDLYLLHWRGSVPLSETVDGFETLRAAGKILAWGVSNFDTDDMRELTTVPAAATCATNQVLYNLNRRGPEFDLLPWMAARHMPLMAYSPVEQGDLADAPALRQIARKHGATPAQVALAWVLRRRDVIAIPKAADPAHVRENAGSVDIALDEDDLQAIDRAFRPPSRKRPLEML